MSGWAVVCSYGLTGRDTKDTGERAKLGVLGGSFTLMATAMKESGSMARHVGKAYMCTQMARST